MGCGFESHGGTAKPLETLASKGFSIPAVLDPNAIRRTHIVRTPNTDRHIIIRAGKHPAILSANAPSSETKPPPTGRILPLADAPTSKTPSQWNNLPVNQSSSGIKLPVTGGNGTQIDLSASENSSEWRNQPVGRPINVPIPPAGGGIIPVTDLLAGKKNPASGGNGTLATLYGVVHLSPSTTRPAVPEPYIACRFPNTGQRLITDMTSRIWPLPIPKGIPSTSHNRKVGNREKIAIQRTRPSLLKKSLGGNYHSVLEFL